MNKKKLNLNFQKIVMIDYLKKNKYHKVNQNLMKKKL